MRVVIHCNVPVLSARSGGVCGKVIVEAFPHHQVVLSRPIVDEYADLAGRLAHVAYRDSLLMIVAELERVAALVEPTKEAFVVRDPDDAVYLQTASAGGAVPVTGNSRDFTEPRYRMRAHRDLLRTARQDEDADRRQAT